MRNIGIACATHFACCLCAQLLILLCSSGIVEAEQPQSFSCSSPGACLTWTNTLPGVAIYGTVTQGQAVQGSSTSGVGVAGGSVNSYGVEGVGLKGVFGQGMGSDGVEGQTNGTSSSGVYAHNDATSGGFGVYAVSHGVGQAVHGENSSLNGWAGFFNGDVSGRSFHATSDARLKKEIKDAPYGLAQLLQLRPVSFRWKASDADSRPEIGLIAQEVRGVIPELVRADEPSGMLSVNYPALVPVMIKALQEQQQLIRRQELRIVALEGRAPMASSVLPSTFGGGVVLGLLPLGLAAAFRRRTRPRVAA